MAATILEGQRAGIPCPNSSSSFWHSEPNPHLLNHRTTPDLPPTADIVIIGSGITGASAARYLAEDPRASSLSVVMLEAREACWGATGRNGGHCQPLLFDRTPEVAMFELRNMEAVRDYIEKHGVQCEWRLAIGCRTFWSPGLMEAAKAEIKELQDSHPELGKMVRAVTDRSELSKHRVKDTAEGVTLTEGAGSLWPYKYVTFIIEKLVKEGRLNLQTNTPVLSMESTSTSAEDAKTTIHTPRGSIVAKNVILATNGYTSHLLPAFTPLIVPVRCEMSALHPPTNSERLPSSYGFVGAHNQNPNYDDYLIQRPFYEDANGKRRGGHLMFGGGRGAAKLPCVGVWEDDVVDQGEASYLRKGLLDTLDLGGDVEGTEELIASHQWTGIKGYSRDNMPWTGKVPDREGVWLAGGYTGHGMPNATLCARAAVQMLLATLSGTPLATIQAQLVASGELPESYLITPERMEKAMENPTVEVQDEHGWLGNQSGEFLERAGVEGKDGGRVGKEEGGRCEVM